jgi:hypothetical protein
MSVSTLKSGSGSGSAAAVGDRYGVMHGDQPVDVVCV